MPKTSRQDQPEHPLGGFAAHAQCCAAKTFKEGGCRITLPGEIPAVICLSGTSYQAGHDFKDKLCDFLLAWERAPAVRRTSVIELKGGHFNISDVRTQLQNGADITADLLTGIDVSFLPVLVHQRMPPVEQRELPKNKITFRGKRYGIFLVKRECEVAALRF